MKRALLAIGFLIGIIAQPAAAAEKVTEATPALWVAHGPKGTVYMLGSIHALPKNVHWQTPAIATAMAAADTFVFELPMDAANRDRIGEMFLKNGLMPMSQSLPSLFDQDMLDQYRQVILTTHADPGAIVYMRPWLAAMVLEGAADGTDKLLASEGVDNRVYAEVANRKGVHFRALETDELQMRLLMGDGDLRTELAALRLAFVQILARKGGQSVDGLLAAWEKGDTKTIETQFGLANKSVSTAAMKAFLEDRNRAWVPQVVGMLNEKHVFFMTVGAAHLAGSTGVPNLLRAQGYKVDGP